MSSTTAIEPEKFAALLLQTLSTTLQEDDVRRADIAQRLHRDVAGSLVACASLGEMMRHELSHAADPDNLSKLLASLDVTLRQSLQLVRDLTEGQFPPVLKAFGLHAALQQLVRSIGENFTGSLVLHINGDEPKFELSSRLNLFRLMQALLKHCVRYANTSWVEVVCQATPAKLEVSIDHDGDDSIWAETGADSQVAIIEARCLLLDSRLQVMRSGTGNNSRLTVTAFAMPSP